MGKKRLVAGYLTLVGLPLLLVLLILKLGEGIRPPPSIDGAWVMDAKTNSRETESQKTEAGADCAGYLGAFSGRTLTVSQSGRFLSASWDHYPETTLRGQLEGKQFTLTSGGKPTGACDAAPLRIEGLLLETEGKHALDARLSVPSCRGCGELELVSLSHNGSSTAVLPRGFR
jgi:hypothetical protein